MPYQVVAIPPHEVREVAGFLWSLIKRACSRGCNEPPEELIASAEKNEALLWVVTDNSIPVGVCITRRVLCGNTVTVWVIVAGGYGGLKWAPPLRDRIHEFRKAEGAAHLVVHGRRGWGRLFGIPPVGMTDTGLFIYEDYGE